MIDSVILNYIYMLIGILNILKLYNYLYLINRLITYKIIPSYKNNGLGGKNYFRSNGNIRTSFISNILFFTP